MADEKITIIRGTGKTLNVTLRDEDGDPINLSALNVPGGDYILSCVKGDAELGTDPVILRTEIDEIQKISFSDVPDAGTWKLSHEGNETTSLAFNATNTDVQNALNALASLSAVVVTGDFSAGFTVTFSGVDGELDQPLLEVSESALTKSSADVTVTVTEETKGYPERITRDVAGLTIGKFQISITKDESPLLETGLGKDIEVKWKIGTPIKGEQAKSVIDVLDSMCD